jgi:hypothetical protein
MLSYKVKKNLKIVGLVLLGLAAAAVIGYSFFPQCRAWMQNAFQKIKDFFAGLFGKK